MRPFLARHLCLIPARTLSVVGAAALACLAVLGASRTAEAQSVYVYAPAPPPPPPPPPPGYYYGPRYAYYEYREPVAAFALAMDFEGAIPLNVPQLDGNTWSGGGGLKIRAGEQLRLRGGVRFTPEVGYGYDRLFVRDDAGDEFDWSLNRVFAGARLGFGRLVVPVFYAHAGYGWQATGEQGEQGNSGFAFDVGGALDFRLLPRVGFGVHIEYAAIETQPDQVSWLALGVHGDILF
jgi:hypothetical protein